MPEHNEKMDHDLLIRIDENLKNLTREVREMGANVMGRIQALEADKAGNAYIEELKKDADMLHDDHEARLRRLEWSMAVAVGAIALLEFYFKFLQ